MQEKKNFKLSELEKYIAAELKGDPNHTISAIAPLDTAGPNEITFLQSKEYQHFLANSKAGAIIIRAEESSLANLNANLLIVSDPYVAYAKLTALFNDAPQQEFGIHTTAVIGTNCSIDPSVRIGANCIIGNNVTIEADACIGPSCVISDGVIIGQRSIFHPRVTVYHKVKIGKRTVIHSGAVIGADGFGNANDRGRWQKIYQLGTVIIGDDVEIGANTTIDRGALADTIIGNGVKLDNLVQVAHNVRIGDHTAVAGCVGIAGSAIIGKHCMIGGGAGINGHIEIADGVIVTGMTGITKSVKERGIYSSLIPAMPHQNWWRILARILKIEDMVKRLTRMEKIINEIVGAKK